VEDEIRGELAQKIRERELAANKLDTEPPKAESTRSDTARPPGSPRLTAAALWILAIAVGVATGSVPAAIATMVGGFLVTCLVVIGRQLVG
jgi:VIT1/CCC1 family predicted Fe2+/Mn2+ transporter